MIPLVNEGPADGPNLHRRAAAAKLLSLAAAFCCALPTGHARAHATDAHPAPPAQAAERAALLQAARNALNQGQSRVALAHLERAALMSHDADTEMLMVMAMLQAGEFRNALNFASHTAGAHKDEPDALALYACLQALSGQPAFAARLVDAGLQRQAGLPALLAVQPLVQALAGAAPAHTPAAWAGPGPWPFGIQPPAQASVRARGTGLLLNKGRHALLPLQLSPVFWLRNGLGEMTEARPVDVNDALAELGLCIAALSPALRLPEGLAALRCAPRDAFAGSPVAALTYPPAPQAQAAWPAMQLGFMGRGNPGTGQAVLDRALPFEATSGPVFDHAGRWLGFIVPAASREPGKGAALVTQSALTPLLSAMLGPLPVDRQGAAQPSDQLYENLLPLTLQIIFAEA